MTADKSKKGFTLMELIIVIAILAILAALLVPSMIGYMDRAKRTVSIDECRQVVQAAQTVYAEEYLAGNYHTSLSAGGDVKSDILALSQAKGEINSISLGEKNEIIHLVYTSSYGHVVTYCGRVATCALHTEMYTIDEMGGGVTNTPEKFYMVGKDGTIMEFTPYANYSTYVPERSENLANTVFYYEGSEEYGHPAGYYVFKNTSPITPNNNGDANFHQIWEWNNAIKINVDRPIKEYVPNSKDFIADLKVGDVCEIDFGDGPVLAVFNVDRKTTEAGSWMWNKDLASQAYKGYWLVIEQESIAPKPK